LWRKGEKKGRRLKTRVVDRERGRKSLLLRHHEKKGKKKEGSFWLGESGEKGNNDEEGKSVLLRTRRKGKKADQIPAEAKEGHGLISS